MTKEQADLQAKAAQLIDALQAQSEHVANLRATLKAAERKQEEAKHGLLSVVAALAEYTPAKEG